MAVQILLAVFLVTLPWSAAEEEVASLRVYFGNGCFWARQHLFVEQFERGVLGRKDSQITAIAGYAGSSRTGTNGTLCYHNSQNFSDYGVLGHAEAVQLDVPRRELVQAFSVYFKSFVESSKAVWDRADSFDQGAEYRSLVGFQGGLDNKDVVAALLRANLHNMTLLRGNGSDADTFGSNAIVVMDSERFPFVQAERCLQFHDDQTVKYPDAYHALRPVLEHSGRIVSTGCPANFVCGPGFAAGNADPTMSSIAFIV